MNGLPSFLRVGLIAAMILLLNPGFTNSDKHKSFKQLWDEIEAFAEKGLPKSALQLLDVLHQKAMAEKNNPQLLKATLYRFSLWQSFEEEHLLKSIGYAKDQLHLLESPGREVLHSVIAELYWFYYQQNQQTILSRTDLLNQPSADPREWDLLRLRNAITEHYDQSLRAQNIMDTIPLKNYEMILVSVPKEAFLLQPSLFDFVAGRALGYYLNNDASLQDVAPTVEMNNLRLWQTASVFATLPMPRGDHQHHIALSLFQKMLASNLRQKHTDALIANEIKRYSFLRTQYGGPESADSLYFDALTNLQSRYEKSPASTEVASLRAAFLLESIESSTKDETKDSDNLAKALEICDAAIKAFPESRGAQLCLQLRQQVLQKELSVNVQRVELPNKPIPAFLNYRNITNPSFRIVRVSSETLENIMGKLDQEERLNAFLKLQSTHQWQIELPFEPDYSLHNTIIDLPALSTGLYVLLVAESADFSPQGIIAFTSFQVSQLSFVSLKRDDINLFYLLDRDSGKAVNGATIRVMTRDYDYTTRRYLVSNRFSLKSGKDGSFEVASDVRIPKNQAFYIEAMTKNDTLYSDNYFDLYERRANTRKQTKTWFFTDRSIYRPGQTVYFKGITLERVGDREWKTGEKLSSLVKFFDVNSREVAAIQLKTNEFGSFEGSFTAPSGVLNGMMRISNEYGSVMFSVEEYKRPTFEVKLEPADKQFKLNDTVMVSGEASAFAGYGLDSVSFTYRVEREKYYPFRPWWRIFPPMSQRKMLIAEGKSFTRTDGSFSIQFNALPEVGSTSNDQAVYSYTVTADVTDRNGETRSNSKRIQIGEVALIMKTNLEKIIAKSDAERFILSAFNLQDRAVNTQVELKFYKLTGQDQLSRSSMWPKPDRNFHSAEKLKLLFPLDNFEYSDDPDSREKTLVHHQSSFVIGSVKLFPDAINTWQDGEYLAEAVAIDDFGREVKMQEIFTLYGEKNKTLPVNELAWFHLNKKEALPGDTVVFFVGSAAKANRVLVEITAGKEVFYSKWHNVSNRKLAIPFVVKEEQRGTLTFQAVFVKHNRLLKSAFDLDVPFTNKMLDISLETKREKLNPGAEETWTFKVSGKNSEKVAAELLASMYDASLDQFRAHSWSFNPIERKPGSARWTSDNGFLSYSTSRLTVYPQIDYHVHPLPLIQLNWFGLQPYFIFGYTDRMRPAMMVKSAHVHENEVDMAAVLESSVSDHVGEELSGATQETGQGATPQATMLRSDFRETAFFFPQLNTDTNGNLSFSFRLPDALTRWNLMLLAHTKDLKTGSNTYNFTASKDLMIVPNQPRFYREGDTAFLAAKIVNTSAETLSGIARLEISDPFTSKALSYFVNNQAQRPFINLKPGQSQELKWHIAVDGKVSMLALRFSVSSGLFTDSEEQIVPVLPSGVLVTETMPMQLAGNSSKTFVFKSLQEQGPKEKNQRLNLQFSNNPTWYAVQALPYIYETGQEHSDNIFYRYYANTLASYVANSIPGVMKVMESWKQAGSDALLSNLEKNESLKSVLLAETPWVIDAADETQQKRNIALLFDLNRMRYEQEQAIKKLLKAQLSDGSWAWFPGMKGSRYITLNIVTGMGKLRQMVPEISRDRQTGIAIANAIQYLDKENVRDYNKMVKDKGLETYKISSQHLGYLYARSFFTDLVADEETQKMIDFYLTHTAKDWLRLDHGMQAMAAMVLHRNEQSDKASGILASLRERAIRDAVLGTYWKPSNTFYFSQTPVETQALLIAAFDEIDNDIAWIDEMRTYLLTQKQTNRWRTGRATAEAVYALLLKGSDWITEIQPLTIIVGGEALESPTAEAGTGLLTKDWFGGGIQKAMATVEVTNPNKVMAWGAMFRQFMVPLDQVKASQTQLSVSKEVFLEKPGKQGMVLVPLKNNPIRVGDKIRVRIVLQADRDMEFVHMKDQRAAAFEPVDVISGYQFNFGLGYYQSTRDASTDFFFGYLPKGKYVFEYSLVAMQRGDFTNGYAKIQSFYAPEFSSHSEGIRVKVLE